MKIINSQNRNRRAAVAVEFALVLPILFIFFFGLWEWSRVEMIRQVSETAVFQAARRGTLPGATTTDAIATANEVFDIYMITGMEIDATIDTTESRVSVEVPLDENTWISSLIFAGKAVNTEMTFKK